MEINQPSLHSVWVDGSRWRWWHMVIFYQLSTLYAHRLWLLSIHFPLFKHKYVIHGCSYNEKHDNFRIFTWNCSKDVHSALTFDTDVLCSSSHSVKLLLSLGLKQWDASEPCRQIPGLWSRKKNVFPNETAVYWVFQSSLVSVKWHTLPQCSHKNICAPFNNACHYIHNVKPGLQQCFQSALN